MVNVFLGPTDNLTLLPQLTWIGSPPSWPVTANKQMEEAVMSDGSIRIAFFGIKRELGIVLGFLSKAQLDAMKALNALKEILDFQNNNEDATTYKVVISAFSHVPERMDIRQLERYRVEMTLREVQ